ncbi:MAG TPA: amidohydrolase family protein [Puia sp.]|nr:amidohydrolase family protein [Puia sp.]
MSKPIKRNLFLMLLLTCFANGAARAQKMDFEEYDPRSTLVVPAHVITRAKYPFIDIHNHQWEMPSQDLSELVREMDKLNMRIMNNLSGRGYKDTNGIFDVQDSTYFKRAQSNIRTHYPDRFIQFSNISFARFGQKGWTERALANLEADVRNGAKGLKIYKDLGMDFKDEQGQRIAVDDRRLDALWDKCAALHIPVLIHSADPPSFWDPMDKYNERWLELKTHPDRKRENTNPASWKTIIGEQHHLFKAHPNTLFIAAHFGWLANDLASLGKLLDECPNVSVEIAAIIAELGRQPRQARDFFIKYQDRILFGKDSWVPSEYTTYFRVLETADEYFPYHKKYHAFWRMYGLALPDEVLKKVYYKNALRIVPGLDKSSFPQ